LVWHTQQALTWPAKLGVCIEKGKEAVHLLLELLNGLLHLLFISLKSLYLFAAASQFFLHRTIELFLLPIETGLELAGSVGQDPLNLIMHQLVRALDNILADRLHIRPILGRHVNADWHIGISTRA
jgi:hypothetical protein